MHFYQILDEYSERMGIPFLTEEYRIACALLDHGTATAAELQRLSNLSSTGFFNTLERMRSNGTIHAEANPKDARSKVYRLDEEISQAILDQFRKYRKSDLAAFESLDSRRARAREEARLGNKASISHLTCEYQILLYLHLQPGLINSEFVDIVNASPTKFNATLARLTALGLLYAIPDIRDRRRKRYFITDTVRATLAELHGRVYAWLESRSKGEEPSKSAD